MQAIRSLVFSLFLLLITLGQGQATTIAPPRLIETIGGEQAIQLQSLHLHSEISGGMAQTTVRMVFYNPNPRQLEGKLQFPLLDGQQITAFSLDINGQLRAAVPVPKAKGRQVFEEIERRNVDPGLLEQTQGNNFQLRIYPIAARGTRTVELQYAEALPLHQQQWHYQLPLSNAAQAKDFSLKLTLHDATQAPQVQGILNKLNFQKIGNDWQAHLQEKPISQPALLQLNIPAKQQASSFVQTFEGEQYFLAEIPIDAKVTPRPLPKVVGLLWDSSGSGAARNHEAEFALLEAYFKAIGNGEVRLLRLRDRGESLQRFHINNGNWQTLRKALQETVYDGASALADWQPQAEVGEYLLVSDGLNNYGDKAFPKLAKGQRLYALNAAVSADAARLSAWAERSGGKLIDLNTLQPEQAAQALLTQGTQVEITQTQGASDVLLVSQQPGLLRLAGRLNAPAAQVQLQLQHAGKARPLHLSISNAAAAHPLAAYLWATSRIRSLEADAELHRAEIGRLGQRFAIPTRETSLIVLERIEDYVRYGITPPTAERAAFDKLNSLKINEQRNKRAQHLEHIVRAFEEKIRWWNKVFPKDAPLKQEAKHKVAEGSVAGFAQDRLREERAQRAAPAMALSRPAPAAAPVALAKSASKDDAASTPSIGITLKKWTADAPYIKRLQNAATADLYAIYLDEKPNYANSSAFYLDVADLLLERKQRELALRVLSNLAELDLENRAVLRILGYRLLQAGAPELAIPVFKKVQTLAEEEPQSFRDLGLAYAAAKQYQAAIDQLNQVVEGAWDGRFADIELTAIAELNAIVATAPGKLDTSRIDPRLLKNLPLDVRVVLTWDADNSDMDLWVTDPNGEKCYYGHRLTYQGGMMSRDFTGGYGPEEFSLRNAKPGKYKIEANFYGNRQQVVAGATTLQVNLFSHYGTRKVQEQSITLRLKERAETVFVGEFEVR